MASNQSLSTSIELGKNGVARPAAICTNSPFTKKERVRCMFCGGDKCSKCSPTAYLVLAKPAIDHLHSTWINDSIIGMQRPSDFLFDECNVLNALKAAKITDVFNLTEPG